MRKYYDYTCDKCGHTWEEFMDPEDGTPLCVACFSTEVTRRFPTPMIGGETPYKTLDKYGIPGKKLVSGKYYRSK